MHVVLVIIGLKTVIGELPPASSSLAANICRRITGRLTNAISKVTISRNACSILFEMDINSKITLTAVCTALYHRVAFFCQSTDVSVQLEALDILGDLLSRFGGT